MSGLQSAPLAEQQRFWHDLAAELIGRWRLGAVDLSWLGYGNNAVFKVRAAGGDFVLRLHPPQRVERAALRSELRWLRALRQNTALTAPFPRALADGRGLFVQSQQERLPPPHAIYGCLFEYLAGRTKSPAALQAADVRRVGVYLGRLHTVGQFRPPSGFMRHRLDWEGLFGEDSPYNPRENSRIITPEQQAVFAAVAERVRGTMRRLGQGAEHFGLIHADLLAKNLLFGAAEADDGLPSALDFEYCGWGYFLYDLAPLLWQLKSARASDYAGLEAALWAGYTAIRPAAAPHRALLEDFIAARQLASCRWLAVNRHHPQLRETAPQLLAQRSAELADFLTGGELRRQSPTL